MPITTAFCTSAKVELLKALHNFSGTGGHTFKLALIKASPAGTYGAATTNYSDVTGNADEASGTGYSAGGATLSNVEPSGSGTTALTDFADVTFTAATISADGALIYNSTSGNRAFSVHDFGSTKTSTGGDFVVQMPTPDAASAILRIA